MPADEVSGLVSRLLLAAIVLTPVLAGCEEGLGPRGGSDLPFTIYGVISPDLDTQTVLVFPIDDFPTQGSPERLDAHVYSVDLSTGEQTTWRDSLLANSDSSFTHAYWAPFRAGYGVQYRLIVERSDGAASSVEVTVPEPVSVSLLDESRAGRVPVAVRGSDFRLLSPEIAYRVYKPGVPPREYSISYAGEEFQDAAGWQVRIKMIRDAYDMNYLYNGEMGAIGGNCRMDFITLGSIHYRAIIGNTIWNPPDGLFNPGLISNPIAMNNVENGYGSVGAGYRIDELLCPSKKLVADSCMLDGLECRSE